ncbi:MAG: SseB family protein [Lachnospiraceae bacterium]|nr:SseB family protein [Lachnospiraceae bacterium]
MTTEEKNLIEIGDFFVIYSNATKKPYISEDRECFIFDTMKEADKFIGEDKRFYRNDRSEKLSQKVYCSKYYSYGIRTIVLKKIKGERVRISIEKADVKPRQYLNDETNANVYRLMETRKKKYLRSLKDNMLFCPISISIRLKGQYPKVSYCNALKNNEMYMPLFTTVQEFEKWNSKQANRWRPLGTTISKIEPERKGHSIIINPDSDKLILYNKVIKDVLKEKKKE